MLRSVRPNSMVARIDDGDIKFTCHTNDRDDKGLKLKLGGSWGGRESDETREMVVRKV